MVNCFTGGGALLRLEKPTDGDGATPVLRVMAARRLLIREEWQPWCRWCLGASRDLLVIVFFMRLFLHLLLDACPDSKVCVVSALLYSRVFL
jgi:hypothetical protein